MLAETDASFSPLLCHAGAHAHRGQIPRISIDPVPSFHWTLWYGTWVAQHRWSPLSTLIKYTHESRGRTEMQGNRSNHQKTDFQTIHWNISIQCWFNLNKIMRINSSSKRLIALYCLFLRPPASKSSLHLTESSEPLRAVDIFMDHFLCCPCWGQELQLLTVMVHRSCTAQRRNRRVTIFNLSGITHHSGNTG